MTVKSEGFFLITDMILYELSGFLFVCFIHGVRHSFFLTMLSIAFASKFRNMSEIHDIL